MRKVTRFPLKKKKGGVPTDLGVIITSTIDAAYRCDQQQQAVAPNDQKVFVRMDMPQKYATKLCRFRKVR
jgi:hypothetical protein